MSGPAVRPVWGPTLLSLGVVLAAVLLLYRDTAIGMVSIWARSETFTHGFLVPPIVAWLIWRRRERLRGVEPGTSAWLLLPAAAMAVLWLLGDLVAVNAATQFAFVGLLVSLTVALLGTQASRLLLFPLGFLFFAVPVGEFMLPQLMEWTADFTVAAVRLSGVPVYREGLQFVIPSGNWSVVEACSGVRYLIASLTVGTLFAYLNYHSLRRRLAFVAVAALVPIVANWLRAYMIVMLGHLSGNQLAVGVDHLIYGWVFFGVVMMLMFVIGARWSEAEPAASAPATPSVQPLLGTRRGPTVAAALLVLTLPHAVLWTLDRFESRAAPVLALPEAPAAGWRATVEPAVVFRPDYKLPSAEAAQSYVSAEGEVGVYVGYYRRQDYERKLVTSTNTLVGSQDADWRRVAAGTREVASDGGTVTMRQDVLSATQPLASGTRELVVRQVYWIGGHLTASDVHAKLAGAVNRLLGRGDDAAVIVLFTPRPGGEERLDAFWRANHHALLAGLQRTRDAR